MLTCRYLASLLEPSSPQKRASAGPTRFELTPEKETVVSGPDDYEPSTSVETPNDNVVDEATRDRRRR